MKHLKFCQLAPMNIHFVQFPLEYFLDTVAALELERIELWGGGPEVCIDTLSFFRVQQIKKMVAQRKLKIACFTPETCFYPIPAGRGYRRRAGSAAEAGGQRKGVFRLAE